MLCGAGKMGNVCGIRSMCVCVLCTLSRVSKIQQCARFHVENDTTKCLVMWCL